MATVEDIWQSALPIGTELMGGQGGLLREVTWAVRLSPRPPAFAGIKGGEIALLSVTTLRLVDERLALAEVVERLSEMGVVAIAYLGAASPDASRLADDLAIPLLALPEGTSLQELEQSITRLLVEKRTELYQRSQEIYRQLTELAIEGRGIPTIVERLSQITGKVVALEDENSQLKLYSPPRGNPFSREDVSELLQQNQIALGRWSVGLHASPSDPPVTRLDLTGQGLSRLVSPVVSKDGIWGYLSMVGRRWDLSDADRLAITRAAAACAIELARERAVLEAQDRMQADFADDLLAGNFPNTDAIMGRAKRLGYDLAPPYAVMVFDAAQQAGEAGPKSNGAKPAADFSVIAQVFDQELARLKTRAIYSFEDNLATLLYPVGEGIDGAGLKRTAGNLSNGITSRLASGVSVGIGHIHPGLEGVKLANQEARQALSIGVRLFGEGCLAYFGDLGIYRLLFSVQNKSELREFYEETLGKLVEYDRRNGAELVKTLEAYFTSCNSPTEAAQKLHTHRNTLLYRLNRICDISGLDLDNPETRLALHLALRVGETLKAGS